MVHTLSMADIGPVLIPAIAALVGILITSLVTYTVGQARMPQRVERLANTRKELSDNRTLTELIDRQIRSELLLSLQTRMSRFFLIGFGSLTLVTLFLLLGVLFAIGIEPESASEYKVASYVILFAFTYFLFLMSFGVHVWIRMHLAADIDPSLIFKFPPLPKWLRGLTKK